MTTSGDSGPALYLHGHPHVRDAEGNVDDGAGVTVELADGSRITHISTDLDEGRIYLYSMYSVGRAGELIIWEGQEDTYQGYDLLEPEAVCTYAAGWWRAVTGPRHETETRTQSAENTAWVPPVTAAPPTAPLAAPSATSEPIPPVPPIPPVSTIPPVPPLPWAGSASAAPLDPAVGAWPLEQPGPGSDSAPPASSGS